MPGGACIDASGSPHARERNTPPTFVWLYHGRLAAIGRAEIARGTAGSDVELTINEIGGSIRLVSSPEEAARIPLGKKVGLVSQTTQRSDNFANIVAEICKRAPDVRAPSFRAEASRQSAAVAASADAADDQAFIDAVSFGNLR